MILQQKFYVLSRLTLIYYLISSSYAQDSLPSIQTPGADLANFPNSAFTLPQDRAYIELSPVNYSGKSDSSSAQYSAGYLLRYGLTDDLELRLFSQGFTVIDDEQKTNGMSPQIFDIKWHLTDETQDSFLPAVGLEFSIQSTWASNVFKNGTNPAFSINFDQTLLYGIAFEYNIGFISQQNDFGQSQYQFAFSWAFQRDVEVIDDISVFINGYTNTATGLTTSAIGGGLQWTPYQRFTAFTNLSTGLTENTPSIFSLVGFAIAF